MRVNNVLTGTKSLQTEVLMRISKSTVAAVLMLMITLFLVSSIAHGQATPQTAKLRGTVKDPSGAAMPAVDVAIIRDGKVQKASKTDELGGFSFDLAPAEYQLAVAAPDFMPYGQRVRVTPNMPSLSLTLSLAGLTTSVDVVGNTNEIVIDAAQSLDATVLSASQIQDLPDDEEDLLAYLQLLAG